ncbi:MAG: hydrolase Nlp/P60 [Chitinophagales bacterium]|nr:MAG: hydrolase Nlp/P60 [Chitinophagales bacterium]
MEYGICRLSMIPLRKEPGHKSEMVTQLLFGETYEVISRKNDWLSIKSTYDDYTGWIARNQHAPCSKAYYLELCQNRQPVALDIVSMALSSERQLPVLIGSTLPAFDGMNFRLGSEKFVYNGQAIIHENNNGFNREKILEKCALKFLHAPYLWGGRTPFGIDCSGFTQVVFKLLDVRLKRDAYQQAISGFDVPFAETANEGDLAFFEDKEGKITHVGIVLKNKRIIHASGKVRIDPFDAYGIYNPETRKYSHKLKMIKRIF